MLNFFAKHHNKIQFYGRQRGSYVAYIDNKAPRNRPSLASGFFAESANLYAPAPYSASVKGALLYLSAA